MHKYMKPVLRHPLARLCPGGRITALLMLPLVPLLVAAWPVDALEIREAAPGAADGEVFFRAPVLLGQRVTTQIIHSVQLTPVVDEYTVQEGRIWGWREKIRSHNAGLPSITPERGRFVYDPPWMIVEGGGHSWQSLYYRVGNETLGKNELRVFPCPRRELWREIPGKRLVFHAVPARL